MSTTLGVVKSIRHDTQVEVYTTGSGVTLLVTEEDNKEGLKVVLDESNIYDLIELLELAAGGPQ